MDRKVDHIDIPFHRDTGDQDMMTTTTFPLALLKDLNGLEAKTKTSMFHILIVSVLMLLTLLGNAIVIITIISCAELRKKRVNVFILSLTFGDLMVCFVSMPIYVFLTVFNQWVPGHVACKFVGYIFIIAVAFPTFLLTAMSMDIYQVRVRNFSVANVYNKRRYSFAQYWRTIWRRGPLHRHWVQARLSTLQRTV